MTLRCFFGLHRPGLPECAGQVLRVRCIDCQKVTSGIVVGECPPILTQPGDPDRHHRASRRVLLFQRRSA